VSCGGDDGHDVVLAMVRRYGACEGPWSCAIPIVDVLHAQGCGSRCSSLSRGDRCFHCSTAGLGIGCCSIGSPAVDEVDIS
jgi:hypothetical protein